MTEGFLVKTTAEEGDWKVTMWGRICAICLVINLRKSVVQVGERSHGARSGARRGTPFPFQNGWLDQLHSRRKIFEVRPNWQPACEQSSIRGGQTHENGYVSPSGSV